jgi:nucleoside-diphosphate-sugar epimerase
MPASEWDKPNPKGGNYNLTKLWAEQLVQDYCAQNDIPWRIFRLANVFGEGDKFSKKKNALQYLINEMKHDRDIELYANGIFYRDYIYVDDLCDMLYRGMEKLPECHIYNVGSGDPVLFHDFIMIAHEVLGSKSKINVIKAKKFHEDVQVKSFQMDVRKINASGIFCNVSPYVRLYRMLKNGI